MMRGITLALKALLNTFLGFVVLVVLDALSVYTGISLGINIINSLVIGILGIPGFGTLLMLKWILVL